MMSEVLLHRFYIVTGLQGQYRVSMAHVMKADVRNPRSLHALFEMLIGRLVADVLPACIGKDEIGNTWLPFATGKHASFQLLAAYLPQFIKHKGCRMNHARFAVFKRL